MSKSLPAVSLTQAFGAEDLRHIVAHSRFLWERLTDPSDEVEGGAFSAADVKRRVERWTEVLGDRAALLKRLAWDGFSIEDAERSLGAPPRFEGPLPPWASTLAEIIDTAAKARSPGPICGDGRNENRLPFEEVLLPIVEMARRRLAIRTADLARRLDGICLVVSETAMRELENCLLRRLSVLCGDTLLNEFSDFRPFGLNLVGAVAVTGGVESRHYDRFVRSLLDDGLKSLFHRYPVLGRMVATIVDFWIQFAAEFLTRLAADRAALDARFAHVAADGTRYPLGAVRAIRGGLSDPHACGRTVLALDFDGGATILYKPKSLALESAFNQLLSWCNDHSGLPSLKTLKVLDRPGYGWVEFVSHAACETDADAELYFERAGMLTCLLYTLRATDCHYENIIAHGAHPVLVDNETIAHPNPKLIDDSTLAFDQEAAATQALWDSVLRTGLLPRWEAGADPANVSDISGLGSPESREREVRIEQWEDIGVDTMRRVEKPMTLPAGGNAPRIGNRWISPAPYRRAMVKGFEGMYRFLTAYREKLLSASGPLARILAEDVRFIFRPTRVYGATLAAACGGANLRDGMDFSIELEHLARALLVARWKPTAFPVLAAELKAMGQLDIPLFTANAGCDALDLGGGAVIEEYFKATARDDVRELVGKLGEADLARQVAVIEGAFDAKIASEEGVAGGDWMARSVPLLDSDSLISEARRVADDLARRAIVEDDGSVNWIGLDYLPRIERYQLQVLNQSLGDGRGGIALFLAALARVTGEERYAALALRALQSIRRQAQSLDVLTGRQLTRFAGLGGGSGVASTIYSLTRVAGLLDQPSLLDDARRLLEWFSDELVEADQHLDVLSGAAGAILALTCLHRATADPLALQIARRCADHILARQEGALGGGSGAFDGGWRTLWERPLTGFSHGAAGIAYALLRLHAITGEPQLRSAAFAGFAYEARTFDAARGNWPDYRHSGLDGPPQFATRWCHGAPGIGLARVGALGLQPTDQLRCEVGEAMRTTSRLPLTAVDHLCCGNFGRIEILNVAGRRLGRQYWVEKALANASNVVARAHASGAYQLFWNLPNSVFNPGFLIGTAGIGYGLLRLAVDQLPSVLLWE